MHPQLRVDVLQPTETSFLTEELESPSSSSVASPSATSTPEYVIEIRPFPAGTPFSPNPPNPLLAYPIKLSASHRKNYFTPRESFDLVSMFKNPMMLMMLFAGVMIFVLPKAMVRIFTPQTISCMLYSDPNLCASQENMDPELVKDVTQRQDRLMNIQNKLQSGDDSGWVYIHSLSVYCAVRVLTRSS